MIKLLKLNNNFQHIYLIFYILIVSITCLIIPSRLVDSNIYWSIGTGLTLTTLLFILSVNDIKKMHLPLNQCRIGFVIGMLVTIITSNSYQFIPMFFLIADHLLAAIFSIIIMKTISYISRALLRKEALGLGDAELAAMGGAWIGIHGISLAMAYAFVTAGLYSFIKLISGKHKTLDPFPFAPFIANGVWLVWLFEPKLWIEQWVKLLAI